MKGRAMRSFSQTKLKQDILVALAVLAVVSVLVTGLILIIRMEPRIIDKNETAGEPPGQSAIAGYVAYEAPDVCKVKICCEPTLDSGYASIWLTNPADNDVLIRAELYSVKTVYNSETGQATFLPDKLLGKTGFLHPGTYVEKVKVNGIRAGEETKVMVKISTMYEESGTSKGIFYIRTTVN